MLKKVRMLTLAVLAVGAVAGASPANAASPHGDWTTQYNVTYKRSYNLCKANWGFGCPSLTYDGSGVYGPNSRYFVWLRTTAGGRTCTDSYYIGANNYIFSESHNC